MRALLASFAVLVSMLVALTEGDAFLLSPGIAHHLRSGAGEPQYAIVHPFSAETYYIVDGTGNPWYYSDAPKTVQPQLDLARRTSSFDERAQVEDQINHIGGTLAVQHINRLC